MWAITSIAAAERPTAPDAAFMTLAPVVVTEKVTSTPAPLSRRCGLCAVRRCLRAATNDVMATSASSTPSMASAMAVRMASFTASLKSAAEIPRSVKLDVNAMAISRVGDALGLALGDEDGLAEGRDVLGLALGLMLGLAEGPVVVGLELGEMLGEALGPSEGDADGDAEGDAVGAELRQHSTH